MLVLSRGHDESIMIGDDIKITVIRINTDKVRLAIEAPADVPVHRQEVYDRIQIELLQGNDAKTVRDGGPDIGDQHG